ncbi:MAG: hypothetical protein GWM98_04765 [Nitrospinaceae bacterium]|nr:hypothetical protein [Deltaproteobacteria bacterium]NIY14232.1 hypothetical protein [Nitrospinaceae bacterium]
MPQPTSSDVHVNAPLTNISVAYLQDQTEFIADKVFPNVPVPKRSDSYFEYQKGDWFRSEAKYRAPGTESAGSGYELSTATYDCKVQALHKDVDDQIRANADAPLNMDADAAEYVTRGLLLKKELDWASNYFTTGVWTGGTGGTDITPNPKWDADDSTPIADIRKEMQAVKVNTGRKPNKLILGEDVWAVLQDHPDFLERITITKDKIITTSLLAAVLELEEVLIAGAVQNTANEGASDSMSYVYTKDALLVYAAPRPSLMQPSGGYTFSWTGYLGASQQGLRISRFRMDHLRSDRIEGEMAYDMKLVGAQLGCFFDATIS